VTCW